MTAEVDLLDNDWEEDGFVARVSKTLSIVKNTDYPCRNSLRSNESVPFVKLPCSHRMPADYAVAWFKCSLRQKETDFSCPHYDEPLKRTCGAKLSYQEVSRLIPLTDDQRQFLEENLAMLVARRLLDFKTCPGCQSCVERQHWNNICVRCTVCSSNMTQTFYFCWICLREWKGQMYNAVRCGNDGCGERVIMPDPLIPCTPEFKQEKIKSEGLSIYPVKEKSPDRKRLALIINNVEFKNTGPRVGAEKDELSLEKLLQALDYTVTTLRDLSAQGMQAAVRDFAGREEHTKSDSCFVACMSHGDRTGLCGIFDCIENEGEEDIFPVEEVFDHLNSIHCTGLLDKPKIILIQSCRGDESGSVVVKDSVSVRRSSTKEHREKDFCCFRSSTPDTPSFRSTLKGSDFIQDIVEIFNKHSHQDHIEELFRKVLLKFRETHPEQMPCKERTTLCKTFYLFPGL